MEYLGIVAIILVVWYFDWKDDKDAAERYELLEKDYRRLQAGTRSLIWNLGNQSEKVPDNIQRLLPIVYDHVSDEMKFEVDKRIKQQLYRN